MRGNASRGSGGELPEALPRCTWTDHPSSLFSFFPPEHHPSHPVPPHAPPPPPIKRHNSIFFFLYKKPLLPICCIVCITLLCCDARVDKPRSSSPLPAVPSRMDLPARQAPRRPVGAATSWTTSRREEGTQASRGSRSWRRPWMGSPWMRRSSARCAHNQFCNNSLTLQQYPPLRLFLPLAQPSHLFSLSALAIQHVVLVYVRPMTWSLTRFDSVRFFSGRLCSPRRTSFLHSFIPSLLRSRLLPCCCHSPAKSKQPAANAGNIDRHPPNNTN